MKIVSFLLSAFLVSFGGFPTSQTTDNQAINVKNSCSIPVENKVYCNKYDVCVSYDGELFDGPSESESQDGAHFLTENENNQMEMGTDYREYLDDYMELAGDAQLKKLFDDDKKNAQYAQVTYSKLGKGWYVLSGYLSGKGDTKIVFYKKVIQASRLSYCLVQYEEADKQYWEPVCKLVASSFK